MPKIGPIEILIIVLLIVVVFGASRIPKIGELLGKALHNIRKKNDFEEETPKPKVVKKLEDDAVSAKINEKIAETKKES